MYHFRIFPLAFLLICFLLLACSKDDPVSSRPTEPYAPSNLYATAASGSQISLTWNDASNDEDGFKIERKIEGSDTWSQIAQTAAGANSYQNTGLTPNTTYFYRVLAFNGVGNSVYSNQASATTPQIIPVAPCNLRVTSALANQINLAWSDSSDNEDGFKIERKIGGGGTWSQIFQTGAGVISYQNSGLTSNTNYYFRVLAFNSAGNSSYSNETNATTSSSEVVILNERFEGVWPGTGWQVAGSPTWNDESYNHHTGSWAAWCAGSSLDPSVSPYANDMDAWMIYGPFDLSDAASGNFSFWEAYRTEVDYDRCFFGLSTDGTNFNGYSRSGDEWTWSQVDGDFTTFADRSWIGNRQVWVGFHFSSDSSITGGGWWMDDVSIVKQTQGVRAITPNARQETDGEVILKVFSPTDALREQNLPRIKKVASSLHGDL